MQKKKVNSVKGVFTKLESLLKQLRFLIELHGHLLLTLHVLTKQKRGKNGNM